MSSHIIRRALPDDATPLSVFAARLFRSTYSDDTAAADLDAYIEGHLTAGHFAAEIADPEGAVFLAMAGDAIAGYIHLLARADEGPLAVLNRILSTPLFAAAAYRARCFRLSSTKLNDAMRPGCSSPFTSATNAPSLFMGRWASSPSARPRLWSATILKRIS